MRRFKTEYPGIFYREVKRAGGKGLEKVYYAVFKRNNKVIEAKLGKQYQDDMTPARAAQKRAALIEGREQTPQEKRDTEKAIKQAEASRWTIAKLWDSYCESHPDNKALRHDMGKFNRYLREAMGDKEPGQLVALDVDRVRLGLQKQGKKTQAARVLEILRRTINYGVKRALIAPLPFKIEVPRLNNQTTEDLTQDQLKALLLALDADEDQAAANVIRLALYTGMRRSEIFKLRWVDLDFEKKFIILHDPKGGRDQTIPMNATAEQILKGIKPKRGNPYVFPGKFKGTNLTDCRKAFDRIKTAAKLPEKFRILHGCRHVYASILASSGQVDLYTLQKLLTHKSPIMTQRYAHLRDDALRQASNLAGDLIKDATTNTIEAKKK